MNSVSISEELPYRIIELELELEHQCTISLVNELVNVYRQLIEACESANDSKFTDFQTRLHKILMRPDVQKMLAQESKMAKAKRTDTKEIEMRRQNFRSRKTSSMEADQSKISRQLSRIIENRSNIEKGTFNKAVNNFESQNANLNERLERRRRQSSIQTVRKLRNLQESDSGAGASDEREKELEEILERNFTLKVEAINQIKKKYEKSIFDEENREQLEIEMDLEIKKQSELFDRIRKDEIKKLKEH